MDFDSQKNAVLAKKDRSVKGSIDFHIRGLCDLLNSKPDFCTTSSCSGRIVLIKIAPSGRKEDSEWLFVSHEEVGPYNMKNELSVLPDEDVWFMFEPFILHVASRSIEDAERVLNIARRSGIKRSGMISAGSKNVVEIIGTDRIATIIAKDKKLLVTEDYFSLLIDQANRKLSRNWQNIERLKKEIERL